MEDSSFSQLSSPETGISNLMNSASSSTRHSQGDASKKLPPPSPIWHTGSSSVNNGTSTILPPKPRKRNKPSAHLGLQEPPPQQHSVLNRRPPLAIRPTHYCPHIATSVSRNPPLSRKVNSPSLPLQKLRPPRVQERPTPGRTTKGKASCGPLREQRLSVLHSGEASDISCAEVLPVKDYKKDSVELQNNASPVQAASTKPRHWRGHKKKPKRGYTTSASSSTMPEPPPPRANCVLNCWPTFCNPPSLNPEPQVNGDPGISYSYVLRVEDYEIWLPPLPYDQDAEGELQIMMEKVAKDFEKWEASKVATSGIDGLNLPCPVDQHNAGSEGIDADPAVDKGKVERQNIASSA